MRKRRRLRDIKSETQIETDKGTETKMSEINHANILYV